MIFQVPIREKQIYRKQRPFPLPSEVEVSRQVVMDKEVETLVAQNPEKEQLMVN